MKCPLIILATGAMLASPAQGQTNCRTAGSIDFCIPPPAKLFSQAEVAALQARMIAQEHTVLAPLAQGTSATACTEAANLAANQVRPDLKVFIRQQCANPKL